MGAFLVHEYAYNVHVRVCTVLKVRIILQGNFAVHLHVVDILLVTANSLKNLHPLWENLIVS